MDPEDFERLLSWLDQDRERAAQKYQTLHRSLTVIFAARGCHIPEELADETLNRVAKRLRTMLDTYEGDDPYPYIYRVAYNLIHEYKRNHSRTEQFPEGLNPSIRPFDEEEERREEERLHQCLERCLERLTDKNRYMVLRYYEEEKQAKIDTRKELGEELGINPNTLRIRTCRVRETLEKCIDRCLQDEASS